MLKTLFQFRAINNISRSQNRLYALPRKFSAKLIAMLFLWRDYATALTTKSKSNQPFIADNTAQTIAIVIVFLTLLRNSLLFCRISVGTQEKIKLQTYTAKARKQTNNGNNKEHRSEGEKIVVRIKQYNSFVRSRFSASLSFSTQYSQRFFITFNSVYNYLFAFSLTKE